MKLETSYSFGDQLFRVMCGLQGFADLLNSLVYLRHSEPTCRIVRLCAAWGLYQPVYAQAFPSSRNVARCFAVAISRKSAVLTGMAAACMLGIPVLGNNACMDTVRLLLPNGMKPSARSQWGEGVTYSSRLVKEEDIVEENGVRVTGISRTFVEFVASGEEEKALSFIEQAFFQRRSTIAQVQWDLKRMEGLMGKPRALKILAHARENSESLYETKARHMIEQAKLACIESIETQAEVPCGDTTYRIDILINGFLGIEIDGRCKTKNNPQALIDERVREKRIQNKGFLIIRYHPDELNSVFIGDIVNILTRYKRRISVA